MQGAVRYMKRHCLFLNIWREHLADLFVGDGITNISLLVLRTFSLGL